MGSETGTSRCRGSRVLRCWDAGHSVVAAADSVRKCLGAIRALTSLHPDMSFQDGELSLNPAAFAHVRARRQAVVGSKHFRTQPHPRIPRSTIWAGRIGLQPMHETVVCRYRMRTASRSWR